MPVVSTGLPPCAWQGKGSRPFQGSPPGKSLRALPAVLLGAGRGRPNLTGQVWPQAALTFPDLVARPENIKKSKNVPIIFQNSENSAFC